MSVVQVCSYVVLLVSRKSVDSSCAAFVLYLYQVLLSYSCGACLLMCTAHCCCMFVVHVSSCVLRLCCMPYVTVCMRCVKLCCLCCGFLGRMFSVISHILLLIILLHSVSMFMCHSLLFFYLYFYLSIINLVFGVLEFVLGLPCTQDWKYNTLT